MSNAQFCKAFGHSWDPVGNLGMHRKTGASHMGWRVHLRCVHCASERMDTCDIRGHLLYRQYIYSTEYRNSQRVKQSDTATIREQYRSNYIRSNR